MSPFKRLIWKEYRAQWNLWVSLQVGVALLVGMIAYAAYPYRTGEIDAALDGLITPGFLLTICFAAASAAMLFAGEEEEETAGLLRQLPVSRSTLFIAKLCWLVLSTLGFLLGSAILVTVIVLMIRFPLQSATTTPEDTLIFGETVFATWIWGIFWSLRLRKVMHVLALTAASLLLGIGLSYNSARGYEHHIHLAGLALVAVAIYWPARRWLQGFSRVSLPAWMEAPLEIPVSTPSSERFPTFQTWGQWITSPRRIWNSFLGLFRPMRLHQRLLRSATRDTAFGRMTSMLIWKEMREAVMHLQIWGLVGVAALVLSCRYSDFPWIWFLAFPLVLECGLKCYRGDHHQNAGMFLTHRGVSPGWIWLIKTSVWLSALLILAFGILSVDYMLEAVHMRATNVAYTQQIPSLLRSLGALRGPATTVPTGNLMYPGITVAEDFWLRVSLAIGGLLGVFSIGQLCSYWFRSPLIAWGAALVSTGCFVTWIGMIIAADLLHVIALWPLVFIWLYAAWSTRKNWQEQRTSWRIQLRQVGWVVLPILLVAFLTWSSRALALNEVSRRHIDAMLFGGRTYVAGPRPEPQMPLLNTLEAFEADLDRVGNTDWNAAWTEYGKFVSTKLRPGFGNMADMSEVNLSTGLELVNRIQELDGRRSWSPPQAFLEAENHELHGTQSYVYQQTRLNIPLAIRVQDHLAMSAGLVDILVTEGNKRESQGDYAGALDAYLICLKFENYLASQATNEGHWNLALVYQGVALLNIERWAAKPEVDAVLLSRAVDGIRDICGVLGPVPGDVLLTQYVLWDQFYQCKGPIWDDEDLHDHVMHTYGLSSSTMKTLTWAERERCRRLLVVKTYIAMNRPLSPHFDGMTGDETDIQRKLIRMSATTPMLSPALGLGVASYDMTMVQTCLNAIARQRGTILVCELQAYQRKHGEFPPNLVELALQMSAADNQSLGFDRVVIDPWSSTYFGYLPNGLPDTMQMDTKLLAPPRQPLLWSLGQWNLNGVPQPINPNNRERQETLKHNPHRVYFVQMGGYHQYLTNEDLVQPEGTSETEVNSSAIGNDGTQ